MFLCVDPRHRDLRGPQPAALGLALGKDCHRCTIGFVVEEHLIAVQWSRYGCLDQSLGQWVIGSEKVSTSLFGLLPIEEVVPCWA